MTVTCDRSRDFKFKRQRGVYNKIRGLHRNLQRVQGNTLVEAWVKSLKLLNSDTRRLHTSVFWTWNKIIKNLFKIKTRGRMVAQALFKIIAKLRCHAGLIAFTNWKTRKICSFQNVYFNYNFKNIFLLYMLSSLYESFLDCTEHLILFTLWTTSRTEHVDLLIFIGILNLCNKKKTQTI